jgi:hypothetical protein
MRDGRGLLQAVEQHGSFWKLKDLDIVSVSLSLTEV